MKYLLQLDKILLRLCRCQSNDLLMVKEIMLLIKFLLFNIYLYSTL